MPNPHLAFGHGRHYRPAARLSRMVLDRLLLSLATRFDRIEPGGPHEHWDSYDGRPLMLRFQSPGAGR